MIVDVFVSEIYGTRRKDVIRLIIAEGPRFPKLAEFYYREVIARVLRSSGRGSRCAVERGELAHDALARFPQLLVAPGLLAIIWSALFESLRAARRRATHARPPRPAVRGEERDMSGRHLVLALLAVLVLAGCCSANEPTFQGWVEAELIFVGPDEAGRVETLSVREGDRVEVDAPLFTLDPDLQLADVAMQEAAVKNAQQAYDRAQQLLSRQPARKRRWTMPRQRCARRRRGSIRRRPGLSAGRCSARSPAPSSRSITAAANGAAGTADRGDLAAGQSQGAVLRP